MTPISVVLAIGAPLLHVRVRSVVAADPGMVLVYDAMSGLDAVQQTSYLTPSIVLCDRQMLTDPNFAGLRLRNEHGPLLVLVTVNSEAMRGKPSLTISGTVPFDTRPGDMASRLRAILLVAAAVSQPDPAQLVRQSTPSPLLLRLSGRFSGPETPLTFTPPLTMAPVTETPVTVKPYQPVPTKTAQLKRTSFLKSMLDDADPVHGREKMPHCPKSRGWPPGLLR